MKKGRSGLRAKKFFFVILTGIIILQYGCHKNKFDVNVSDIDVSVKIQRFEKDLFSIPLDSIETNIPRLQKQYGNFFPLFNHAIINVGSSNNPGYPDLLRSFITDYSIYQDYNEVMKKFPDLNFLEKDLTEAFKHYRYYYPDQPVPRVVTYISGFNQSVVTDSALIGISLDKYLGKDEELYQRISPPLSQYMLDRMVKAKIPSDCMQAFGSMEFEYNNDVNNLVNNMIYNGKIMYFVKAMLPDEPDTLIWGFSSKQMEFCNKAEKEMWTYLVESKLLFNNDKFTISKFVDFGPFTKDFGRNSPARAAVWLGYRIVNAYMDHHRDLSLNDLMLENDYQKMLNQSKYNP